MKALKAITILFGMTLAASAVLAQTPPAGQTSEPKILNAKPSAEKPAAEPYAGQKPVSSTPEVTAPAPVPAAPPSAAATPDATGPAVKAAATAAKAASEAQESKTPAPVPDGPAVKPIGKTEPAKAALPSEAAKGETKAEAKSEPIPTVAKPEPKPTLLVSIDLGSQKLSVTENGMPKYKWSISSGRTGYLTPKGTFRPVWMSKMWYSRKYDYAPMPHAIFFHGGAAIHGTDSVYALGRPASHGCVRLSPSNAATLFRLVTKHGKQMTRITVFGTPKQGPMAARDGDGERMRASARPRRYQDEPWWNDDDDYPPPPRRYSDRYYDRYDGPSPYPPRRRRYVRDYDPYGDDF